MLDNYKKEYETIEVPMHLKAKTVLKMEEEKRKRKLFFMIKMVTASLSVCILIIGTLFFTKGDKNTTFIKGETIEKVYVDNQEIIFDNTENDLKLAGDGILKRQMITQDKALQLWKNPLSDLGLEKSSEGSTMYYAYYKNITPMYIEIVKTIPINGKQLQLMINNHDQKIETNSKVGGKDVYVSYKNSGGKAMYTMMFTLKGINYFITSKDVEQEEFIKGCVTILKKIK